MLRLCLHRNRTTWLGLAIAASGALPDPPLSWQLATGWTSPSVLPGGGAEPGIPAGQQSR